MKRNSEADSFSTGVKHCVIPVEEVETEDPVAYVRCVHEAQLALTRRVLNVCRARKNIDNVVNLECDIAEAVIIVTGAHGSGQPVLKLIEI